MNWIDGILSMLRLRPRKRASEEDARRAREEARRLREAQIRLHVLDVKSDIIARRKSH